jgi:hypothetical protein
LHESEVGRLKQKAALKTFDLSISEMSDIQKKRSVESPEAKSDNVSEN